MRRFEAVMLAALPRRRIVPAQHLITKQYSVDVTKYQSRDGMKQAARAMAARLAHESFTVYVEPMMDLPGAQAKRVTDRDGTRVYRIVSQYQVDADEWHSRVDVCVTDDPLT